MRAFRRAKGRGAGREALQLPVERWLPVPGLRPHPPGLGPPPRFPRRPVLPPGLGCWWVEANRGWISRRPGLPRPKRWVAWCAGSDQMDSRSVMARASGALSPEVDSRAVVACPRGWVAAWVAGAPVSSDQRQLLLPVALPRPEWVGPWPLANRASAPNPAIRPGLIPGRWRAAAVWLGLARLMRPPSSWRSGVSRETSPIAWARARPTSSQRRRPDEPEGRGRSPTGPFKHHRATGIQNRSTWNASLRWTPARGRQPAPAVSNVGSRLAANHRVRHPWRELVAHSHARSRVEAGQGGRIHQPRRGRIHQPRSPSLDLSPSCSTADRAASLASDRRTNLHPDPQILSRHWRSETSVPPGRRASRGDPMLTWW